MSETVTGTDDGTVPGRVPGRVSGTQDFESALPLHLHTTPTPSPSTSSRNMALRSGEGITAMIRDIPQAAALARLVLDIRPDWNPVEVFQWASSDPRPWSVVVAAGIGGARNPGIRFVGGLAKAGPLQLEAPQTYPSVSEALNPQLCEHEFRLGACPFCRGGAAA